MEFLMTLFVWVLLGLGIGAAAKFLMPGPDGGGLVITGLLGIGGALLGGTIAGWLGLASFTGFSFSGLAIAVLGAMALLAVHRMMRGRTAH